MNTPADGLPLFTADPQDPKEVAFRRFCHLMDCRHFNNLCGKDHASRSWEREFGPEIEALAKQYPDFDARFAQHVLKRAADLRQADADARYWKRQSREALSALRRKRQ